MKKSLCRLSLNGNRKSNADSKIISLNSEITRTNINANTEFERQGRNEVTQKKNLFAVSKSKIPGSLMKTIETTSNQNMKNNKPLAAAGNKNRVNSHFSPHRIDILPFGAEKNFNSVYRSALMSPERCSSKLLKGMLMLKSIEEIKQNSISEFIKNRKMLNEAYLKLFEDPTLKKENTLRKQNKKLERPNTNILLCKDKEKSGDDKESIKAIPQIVKDAASPQYEPTTKRKKNSVKTIGTISCDYRAINNTRLANSNMLYLFHPLKIYSRAIIWM